ncbi:MAG: segregation/condensation protein A [Chloroflexi bacterium]|nr:segregation/condensation protein A [Chloroflexota bacterium]
MNWFACHTFSIDIYAESFYLIDVFEAEILTDRYNADMFQPPDERMKYKVQTEVYQGPLDLLLQLIERAELDISKLALAKVTDQFLEYMRSLKERRAERVSEFLVVASRLMQIKSEALLPRPVVRQPDEEDPGEALVQQLIMYKRYKELAALLAERQAKGLRSFLRTAPPPKLEGKLDLSGVGLEDLQTAAINAILNQAPRVPLGRVVAAPRVTIREKIRLIADRLKLNRSTRFADLVAETPGRLHVVVTFLAMLEMVRRHRIAARQQALFGDIELERDDEWGEELDFEIEFAE